MNQVRFLCGNQKIDTIFYRNNIVLNFVDGSSFKLPKAMSASGVKYANSDDSIVFWNKGEEAIFKKGGKEYTRCVSDKVSRKETPFPTASQALVKYGNLDEQDRGTPRIVLASQGKYSLVSNNEYFEILKGRIQATKLTAKTWFENRCNEFWIGQRDNGKYISIERHGYHQDGCPGDPEASPRYDTFLIDAKTEEISYDDVMAGKIITFDEWTKGIAQEKQTSDYAVGLVKSLPEVINYLQQVSGKGRVDVDHETNESWEVHVYTIEEYPEITDIPSHTATFNWYSVNKTTGAIDCSFFIYKNGVLEKGSDDYPCHRQPTITY